MIFTVTLNPSLDYVVSADHFKTGMINHTTSEYLFAGGKGINVAIILKELGFDVTALGFLAGFSGQEIERQLKELSLNSRFIYVTNGFSRINVKLKSDEETELNGIGPKIGQTDIRRLNDQLKYLLKEDDILVLSGSIPSCVPDTIYSVIIELVKDKNVKTILDTTGDSLMKALSFHPFLIKPNHLELGQLFHIDISTKQDAANYAKQLRSLGACNVLVSMGKAGAVLVTETGETYSSSAPQGTVRNSVGAGDSMVAGFIGGYLESGNYEQAFLKGICAGSASAFSYGLAHKEEIEALVQAHRDMIQKL